MLYYMEKLLLVVLVCCIVIENNMIMPNSDQVRRTKAKARLLLRSRKGTFSETYLNELIRKISSQKNVSVETIIKRLSKKAPQSKSSTLSSRLKKATTMATLQPPDPSIPSISNSYNLTSNSSANATVDPCSLNDTTRYRCEEMAQTINAKWASVIVGLTFIPGIVFCLLFCRYIPEQYLKLTQDWWWGQQSTGVREVVEEIFRFNKMFIFIYMERKVIYVDDYGICSRGFPEHSSGNNCNSQRSHSAK